MSTAPSSVLEENIFIKQSFWHHLVWTDWLWNILLLIACCTVYGVYGAQMDIYEKGILAFTTLSLAAVAWKWKQIQWLVISVAGCSITAIVLYGNDLSLAQSQFFLKYLFSSQSAIMWMSALFVLATVTYLLALLLNSVFTNKVASSMTWAAVLMGLVGLLVRWWESYLISPDVGHIPVSNLYEVFILFAVITALIYLYYEQRMKNYTMGSFVLLVISAAVAFLLWYAKTRNADVISPLVPALQSYWMKIHVPANFIGYGAFALAAMLGTAYLWRVRIERSNPDGFWAQRLPELALLDEVMYRAIMLGFAFFTIATVLGAMWAAEAWGGYWSWDPKETWALIVWLNYAAWLHLRLTKGWRGTPLAWWSVIGLLITVFAFLGVNMFLSGLHSYGEL